MKKSQKDIILYSFYVGLCLLTIFLVIFLNFSAKYVCIKWIGPFVLETTDKQILATYCAPR